MSKKSGGKRTTVKRKTGSNASGKRPTSTKPAARAPAAKKAPRAIDRERRERVMQLLNIGGRLAAVCTVAAVVLALINAVTAPVIAENKRRAFEQGIQAVLAEAVGGPYTIDGRIESADGELPESVRSMYPAQAGGANDPAAYVVELTGLGYGGDMQILAGYYPDGELFGARLMENAETPGLGKKAEDPEYMDKFVGHGADGPIPTSKTELEPGEADAISGATVTFLGVAQALEAGRQAIDGSVTRE